MGVRVLRVMSMEVSQVGPPPMWMWRTLVRLLMM